MSKRYIMTKWSPCHKPYDHPHLFSTEYYRSNATIRINATFFTVMSQTHVHCLLENAHTAIWVNIYKHIWICIHMFVTSLDKRVAFTVSMGVRCFKRFDPYFSTVAIALSVSLLFFSYFLFWGEGALLDICYFKLSI